jgi:hypothetical protein
MFGVIETALGFFVVSSDGCRPAGFAVPMEVVRRMRGRRSIGKGKRGYVNVPDLGLLIRATGDLLDVRNSLEHIVEVDMRSILATSTLPERKCVNHDNVGGTDDSITSTISELVPGVGGSDLDARGQLGFDGADLVLELLACEVSAVECLGTDGYGVDGIGEFIGNVRNGLEIFVEGLFDIGPISCVSELSNVRL